MHKILLCLLLTLAPGSFIFGDMFKLNKLNYCKLTPSKFNDYEPAVFPSINDLLRVNYNQLAEQGNKIIVRGRVLDENCIPVSDAKIYIWQVGIDGKYHYTPLKDKINQNLIHNKQAESNFSGAGTAISNNQGEFYFVTLKPASVSKSLPVINIRITHPNLRTLETNLAIIEKNLASAPIEIRQDFISSVNNTPLYDFELVMKGETTTRY